MHTWIQRSKTVLIANRYRADGLCNRALGTPSSLVAVPALNTMLKKEQQYVRWHDKPPPVERVEARVEALSSKMRSLSYSS